MSTATVVSLFPPVSAPQQQGTAIGSGGNTGPAVGARNAQAVSRSGDREMSEAEARDAELQRLNGTEEPAESAQGVRRNQALAKQQQQIDAESVVISKQQRASEIRKILDQRLVQEQQRSANGGAAPISARIGPITAYKVFIDDVKYAAPMHAGTFTWSSAFGATGLWSPYHAGQDFGAPAGTPVYAPVDAIVGHPINEWWPGNHVVLYHPDGASTIYAHLTSSVVQTGTTVKAGQLIGYVGSTGRSFGSHLHFEYYPPGMITGSMLEATDPMTWLRANGVVM